MMRVRILTLSVWNTEGNSRRLEIISRELRKRNPDLIAFQEVVQTADIQMLDRLIGGLGF